MLLHFPVALKVASKGFLSSLDLQTLESFTFAFDGGDGFRITPVSYSTARHCSHLFESERELVQNKGNTPNRKGSEGATGLRLGQ